MGNWKAVDVRGNPITSVFAGSVREARAEVKRQLSKNPSRRAFLQRWLEGGEIVERANDATWSEIAEDAAVAQVDDEGKW